MSHMVIFQTLDGNPGYNQFETLEEAVRFVETLRNEQGVETARMFALEEVKFDFKPYFRVEVDPPAVTAGSSASTASAPLPPREPAAEPTRTAFTPPPAPPAAAPQASPFGAPGAVTFGDVPSAPADVQSPVGGVDSPVGSAPAAPTFMAPPAAEAESGEQPTRRGLFGR